MKDLLYDGICFHAQQCAEKYLKAKLCEAGIHVEKVHDLPALLEQLLPKVLTTDDGKNRDRLALRSPPVAALTSEHSRITIRP